MEQPVSIATHESTTGSRVLVVEGRKDGRGQAQVDLQNLLRRIAQEQLPLSEITDRYIEAIIEVAGGNKVAAAKILGIDRKTLYRRADRRRRRNQGG
ncbi:MAG: helix-turn-helix domain-containing protein [Myxococcota bacterium]|nr:helix-turn-helix domain-containing protein [Myxococcota bacterium]